MAIHIGHESSDGIAECPPQLSVDCVMICSAALTKHRLVTLWRTERQTPDPSIYRAMPICCIMRRAVKQCANCTRMHHLIKNVKTFPGEGYHPQTPTHSTHHSENPGVAAAHVRVENCGHWSIANVHCSWSVRAANTTTICQPVAETVVVPKNVARQACICRSERGVVAWLID